MKGEKPPVSKTMPLLMLPDDLVLNCLARVSRLHYPTLSLVSKRLQSLVTSVELYKTRTLLDCTETCLYVCLEFPGVSNPTRLFSLSRRPMQIPDPNPPCFAPYRLLKNCIRKKEKKLNDNCLVSVPTLDSPHVNWWNLTTVGCNIYHLGGYINNLPTSKVFFMDCRSHTWHEAPSMQIARGSPKVSVLDGKIYVVGGNEDCDSSNWIEFFDTKSQVWEHIESPDDKEIRDCISKILPIKGKLYLFGSKDVVYNPKENRWDELRPEETIWYTSYYPSCIIDNVIYCYRPSEQFEWYDFESRSWRVVKGLKKLPKLLKDYNCISLVNYDGKMVVMWEKSFLFEKQFWYAEISLERRNGQEIHGKIEWYDVVHTDSESCEFGNFFTVVV